MARGRLLLVAVLLGTPLVANATDAPHEAGTLCSNCHMGHNAPGASLTKELGNFVLCQSCHLSETGFGFPWGPSDQAVPGSSGTSHRWDAPATNRGAMPPPAGTPMGDRLEGGKLQCSTCHDQHEADQHAVEGRGSQRVSVPVGVAQAAVGTGTGTLTVGAPVGAAAAAKSYLVEIVATGSASTATFRLSNDKGTSWFGCVAPSIYTYVAYAANACLAGASVPLNDGANVNVTFAGADGELVAGDRWEFYVSYPYLRVHNAGGAMCTTCHKDRNMTWQNADGVGPVVGTGQPVVFGTTRFSHPVNQALNQDGRTNGLAGGILDANGMPQATSTDPNRTNDFVLGAGGVVTCLTCHHPHNADSNSLSPDPR